MPDVDRKTRHAVYMARIVPAELRQLVSRFLKTCRADATRRAYEQAIRDFIVRSKVESTVDLAAMATDDAAAYRGGLRKERRQAASYVNKQLTALRCFFAWLVLEEVVPRNPFASVEPYAVSRESRTEGLEEDEVQRMIEVAGEGIGLRGLRDRALLITLYYLGLRRSEASSLNLGDFRRDQGVVLLRDTKTTDWDKVAVRPEVLVAIDKYTAARPPKAADRGADEGDAVFVSLSRRAFGERLSPHSILTIVKSVATSAGIGRNIVAHSLRHACVTHAIDNGASYEEAGAHVRQRDPGTTARYDRHRRDRGAKAAAVLPLLR
jgi:integrase/recombinase XerD